MPAGLSIALGGAVAAFLLIAFVMTGSAVLWIEQRRTDVRGWPVVGGLLDGLLAWLETGIIGAARIVVGVATALLHWADTLVWPAVQNLAQAVVGLLAQVVDGMRAEVTTLTGAVALTVLPPVDRDIPAWFKRLDDEMRSLPNEPAFRRDGPVANILQWLSAIWAVASRLGPFIRLVALPVLLGLGLLWGLVETIGRIVRLEGTVAGLTRYSEAIRQDQLADEHNVQQLFTLWNQTSQQVAILQVDLERERAARVALATQEEHARADLQTALEGQRQADKAQWSPLLILAVLAALGAAGVDTLRKTAECDPCAQLDDALPDLEERVSALETFGE